MATARLPESAVHMYLAILGTKKNEGYREMVNELQGIKHGFQFLIEFKAGLLHCLLSVLIHLLRK